MAYTIVGLFPSQEYSKAVSAGLENNGFKNENYIIYLEEKKHSPKSFWSKFFTEEIDEEAVAVDSLIVSVAVNNSEDLESAKKVFKENPPPLIVCHQEGERILKNHVPIKMLKDFLKT